MKCGIRIKATTYLLLTLLVYGCTTSRPLLPDTEPDISRIRVDAKSKRMDGSAEMITRCSGFVLSEKLVRDFLMYAARVKDDNPDKYYRVLPCSSTGNAIINGKKYFWVIRAGGVGEIFTGKEHFIAVCGKNCCDKAPGIC
jgi:hypothetical protein